MLTREEAEHLENFINECVDKLISRNGMDVVYDEFCFKHSIHCRIRDLTEEKEPLLNRIHNLRYSMHHNLDDANDRLIAILREIAEKIEC